jgi:SAM-dependent methyltransferase
MNSALDIRLETVPCPRCASVRREALVDTLPNFHNRQDPHRYSFVRCADCGLAYLNPRPINLDACYTDDYVKHHSHTPKPAHLRTWSRRLLHRLFLDYPPTPPLKRFWKPLLQKRWNEYRRNHPHMLLPWRGERRGRLLDVGSGAGDKALKYRLMGWNVTGVETDAEAAARARATHGLDIRAGFLHEQNLPPESFDAATLMCVLEHVPAPLSLLREVHALLAPGGVLLIDVPHWNSRLREAFGAAWTQYSIPEHWLVPTEADLRAMVEEAGFRVEWVEHRCSMGLYKTSLKRAAELGTLDPSLPTDKAGIERWFDEAIERKQGELLLLLAVKG